MSNVSDKFVSGSSGANSLFWKLANYSCWKQWPFWVIEACLFENVADRAEQSPGPQDAIIFEFAAPSDMDAIKAFLDSNNRAESGAIVSRFFSETHRCVIARMEKRIIGVMSVFSREYVLTVDDYRTTNLRIRMNDSSVFTGNVYVAPEYRNHGIFRRLTNFVLQRYPPGTRFYAIIARINTSSIKAHERLGYRAFAMFRFIHFLRSTWLGMKREKENRWQYFGDRWPVLQLDKMEFVPD